MEEMSYDVWNIIDQPFMLSKLRLEKHLGRTTANYRLPQIQENFGFRQASRLKPLLQKEQTPP